MSAALLVFPLEKVICPFCMSQFDRRANEADRRTCPACAETLRQSHVQAEGHRHHLRESVRNSGGDVAAFDHALETHFKNLLGGRI
jgi:predicted amidophosphoribosyltransferase